MLLLIFLPILLANQLDAVTPVESPLIVVTWNIEGCAGGMDAIVKTLRELNADIICLQEAEKDTTRSKNIDQAVEIARRLQLKCYSAGSVFTAGGEQHMAILSRRALSHAENLDASTGRIYGVSGTIQMQNHTIRIFTVHLTGTYKVELRHAMKTAAARFRESQDLSTRLARCKEPLILAGDFNAMPGMAERREVGLHAIPCASTDPTFPSDHPSVRIDEIFHSGDFVTVSCDVKDFRASDHRPMVAEFRIASPASRPASSPQRDSSTSQRK